MRRDAFNYAIQPQTQGSIFLPFPPLRGGEKKSKNQKQGREIKGKERGNENEEGQKKGKKGGKEKL